MCEVKRVLREKSWGQKRRGRKKGMLIRDCNFLDSSSFFSTNVHPISSLSFEVNRMEIQQSGVSLVLTFFLFCRELRSCHQA